MENLRLAARRFQASLGTDGRGMSTRTLIQNLGELFRDSDPAVHHTRIMDDVAAYLPSQDPRIWICGAALPRVSTATVRDLLGEIRIRRFASVLNIDIRAALRGLTIALPTMVADFSIPHASSIRGGAKALKPAA